MSAPPTAAALIAAAAADAAAAAAASAVDPAKSALLHIEVALSAADVKQLEDELHSVHGQADARAKVCAAHQQRLLDLIRASPALPLLHETMATPTEEDLKALIAVAQRYKALGNTCFGKHQYVDAIRQYSRALLFAASSPALAAMCYTNRATCLFHLGRYDACVSDCREATEIDATYEKAWTRMAEAQARRGQWTQVADIAATRLNTPAAKEGLAKLLAEAEAKVKANGPTEEKPLEYGANTHRLPSYTTIPAAHRNPSIAHAAASIERQQSKEQGRYITARQDIPVGETLISEPAYAAVLRNTLRPKLPPIRPTTPAAAAASSTSSSSSSSSDALVDIDDSRCEWCFSSFRLPALPSAPAATSTSGSLPLSFLTCRRCPELYCSAACRDLAKEEHAAECGMQRGLQLLPEVTRLAMRMAVKGYKEKQKQPAREGASADASSRWQADATDVDSLLPHLVDMPASALVEYEFQAAVCHYVFQRVHHAQQTPAVAAAGGVDAPHPSLQYPALLRHLCQTRTNVYAVTTLQHTVSDESPSQQTAVVSTAEQIRLALAVFPTAALLNHACAPNVALKFHGRHLTVRAIEPIPAGGEVLNCYGPDRARMKLRGRQKILPEEYLFECRCRACVDGHDFDEFRCTKKGCTGSLVEQRVVVAPAASTSTSSSSDPATAAVATSEDVPPICDTCKEACNDIADLKSQQAILECDLLAARDAVDADDLPTAFGLGTELLRKQRALFVEKHSHLSQTLDLLAECCAHGERFAEAAVYLQLAIDIVAHMFGPGSIEVAHEWCKLAQLHFHAQQADEALAVIARALPILQLYEDDASDEVVDLMRMQVELNMMRESAGGAKKAIKA